MAGGLLGRTSAFVANEEGFRSRPYLRKGDRPTVGYGSTFYSDGTPVTLDDPPITEADARLLLEAVVARCLKRVEKYVHIELDDDARVALADFEYNTGALATSTFLARLNAGDRMSALRELRRWIHSGGRVLPGLIDRREREARLLFPELLEDT